MPNLDPKPFQCVDCILRIDLEGFAKTPEGFFFYPRPEYSQNRKDYR